MEKVLCDSSFIVSFPKVIHCHFFKYRGKMCSVSFILIEEFKLSYLFIWIGNRSYYRFNAEIMRILKNRILESYSASETFQLSTTVKYNAYFSLWGKFWRNNIIFAFYLRSQGNITYLHLVYTMKVKWKGHII